MSVYTMRPMECLDTIRNLRRFHAARILQKYRRKRRRTTDLLQVLLQEMVELTSPRLSLYQFDGVEFVEQTQG
jgi:hypothetical protein